MGGKRHYRQPPLPKHYNTAKPGQCRFCGEPVTKGDGKVNKRANWHPACAFTWTIMNSPSDARKWVFVRDRGLCCDCGKPCYPHSEEKLCKAVERIMTGKHPGALGDWEVDHDHPISKANGNPDHWKMENLRTRCKECHLEKTNADKERFKDT